MTEFPDEYGEILRRAMRAEADSVVPSPDGLEIIRNRIEQRGLRGIFWWRVAASAVGAALVAATIVMVVPGLREQATPPPQGITEIDAETDAPEGESTSRPPNIRPPEVSSTGAVVPPTSARPSLAPTRTTPSASTPTPTPSRTRECPSPAPKGKDASGTPGPCPTTSTTPTPTPTPTPSKTDTETPKDPTCAPEDCPTSQPEPTVTDQESAEPTLSTKQEE
ncbi:hypothetical protein AB0K60_11605 [Thermopolyspora sp. NPDC052614]|uniref:hypothetical protein n=1 Tax=Thermopolyspora sp. NPDC052614 TaxID=3155682 RepID=UPI00341F5657